MYKMIGEVKLNQLTKMKNIILNKIAEIKNKFSDMDNEIENEIETTYAFYNFLKIQQ